MATPPRKRGGRAKGYFPKVREARKALADAAAELLAEYRALAQKAALKEDFETAETILWNLITHMPEDEETGTLLNTNIDKNREPDQPNLGPAIQIGLALGGMPANPKALPQVIQIKPDPDHK